MGEEDDWEQANEQGFWEGWPRDADGVYVDPQVWEHQLEPLTVRWLLTAVENLPLDMEVEVNLYDGSGTSPYQPVDLTVDHRAVPPRLVMTATRLTSDG